MRNEIDYYVERYGNELRMFFKSRVSNRFDAEDLFQDMWLKVLASPQSLHEVKHIRGWLFQLSKNIIIDFYRKNNWEIPMDSLPEDVFFETKEPFIQDNYNKECSSYLLSELKEMPKKYQLPLWLHVGESWKHKQISAHMNLTLSGSKTRVQRAKIKLKQALIDCCLVQADSYGNIIRYESKDLCC